MFENFIVVSIYQINEFERNVVFLIYSKYDNVNDIEYWTTNAEEHNIILSLISHLEFSRREWFSERTNFIVYMTSK